jgi:hypothetical protein
VAWTIARTPVLMASGRRGQAATTRVRSGGRSGLEVGPDGLGTSAGTSPSACCRNSATGILVAASCPQSSNPQARGSSPLGRNSQVIWPRKPGVWLGRSPRYSMLSKSADREKLLFAGCLTVADGEAGPCCCRCLLRQSARALRTRPHERAGRCHFAASMVNTIPVRVEAQSGRSMGPARVAKVVERVGRIDRRCETASVGQTDGICQGGETCRLGMKSNHSRNPDAYKNRQIYHLGQHKRRLGLCGSP